WCGAGAGMEVASIVAHTGEEPFLTGGRGVGNVFFSRCNMACVFCQNHSISHQNHGVLYSPEELAERLLELQDQGCPTVGLVSPTQYLAPVRETIVIARNRGLSVPVVWNSNAFESISALRTLDGLVDIYLPDLKYADDAYSVEYSSAPGYVAASRAAVMEMWRQAGVLKIEGGLARKGLCVRHLVLPNGISGTDDILGFIAGISKEITVSLMSQYNPLFRAGEHPLLSRRLWQSEYWRAVETAEALGLSNTLIQEPETSPETFIPDFGRKNPFEHP
ncbi:MAG: radical SAM protein, partial [Candidatus Fermentibacteraceae bacterium]